MTDPMKTVAADPVPLIIPVRKPIEKCLRLHRLVERRIKYTHHQRIRHQFPAGLHAHQIRRIMERRKVVALRHGLGHLVCDHHGTRKLFPAMHKPVSNHINFPKILYHAFFRVRQRVQQRMNRLRMIFHRHRLF